MSNTYQRDNSKSRERFTKPMSPYILIVSMSIMWGPKLTQGILTEKVCLAESPACQ